MRASPPLDHHRPSGYVGVCRLPGPYVRQSLCRHGDGVCQCLRAYPGRDLHLAQPDAARVPDGADATEFFLSHPICESADTASKERLLPHLVFSNGLSLVLEV